MSAVHWKLIIHVGWASHAAPMIQGTEARPQVYKESYSDYIMVGVGGAVNVRGKRDQFASRGALCDFNAEVNEA